MLSLAAVIIAAGYGILIKRYLRRTSSKVVNRCLTRRGLALFTTLFIVSLIWGVMSFILTPSVDVFSTFMGYYPGAIYDEELVIGGRLLLSRLEDVVWVGALLAFSQRTTIDHGIKKRRLGCVRCA